MKTSIKIALIILNLTCCIFKNVLASNALAELYDPQTTAILQIIHGKDFLSPGGIEFIDFIVSDIDLMNKRVMDFGCGFCGPAKHFAQTYHAHVDAFEINPYIFNQTLLELQKNGMEQTLTLHLLTSSTIPMPNDSLDVIFSKEVLLHVEDKPKLFCEFYRLLKKGGSLIISDWLTAHPNNPSSQPQRSARDEYLSMLRAAGFNIENVIDMSEKLIEYMQTEYEFLLARESIDALAYPGIKESFAQMWKTHIEMLKAKIVQPYVFKAKKP